MPGIDNEAVFTIRHAADIRRMESHLKPGSKAVLLGDSFIAFEAASALRERGLDVTVIARSQQPFAKKFGPEVAQVLTSLHRQNGVHVLTEKEAERIESEPGPSSTVVLTSGERLEADVILIAIGVKPVTQYAPDLPQGRRGGFATTPSLQVSAHIWTAGDIASVDGVRIEHWRLAEQHGRVAAASMLADITGSVSEPFDGVPFFWTFHFGKRFGYAGHADEWDRIEMIGSPTELNFIALYSKAETLKAALGCGRDTAIASLMEPLRGGSLSVTEARRIVAAAA